MDSIAPGNSTIAISNNWAYHHIVLVHLCERYLFTLQSQESPAILRQIIRARIRIGFLGCSLDK